MFDLVILFIDKYFLWLAIAIGTYKLLHIIGNAVKKQELQKEQKSLADKKRYQHNKQQGLSRAA